MQVFIEQSSSLFALQATTERGLSFTMDASPASGGQGKGPTPMELLLGSLGGCASMEVLNALQRAGYPDFTLKTTVQGKKNDQAPGLGHIHLIFHFHGTVDQESAHHFIEKILHDHCSVLAMIKNNTQVSFSTAFYS